MKKESITHWDGWCGWLLCLLFWNNDNTWVISLFLPGVKATEASKLCASEAGHLTSLRATCLEAMVMGSDFKADRGAFDICGELR